MIGQSILHFRILEKLGGGGMGVVYKAQDTKLDRFVALKFLSPRLSSDEDAKARFIQEARAASALDHPNICTMYDVDETPDGQTFIVMAYYDGETLKSTLERGPMPVARAVDITCQVARGLERAHNHGIVHRDIKPANIIVTVENVAKILDFGLAKLGRGSGITRDGVTMGTVSYMSPEQALGEEVNHQTDIWSLGVVLYECLTGKMPFGGEHEQAVIYSILNREPKPVTSFRSDLFEDIEVILRKAMEKKPALRYQKTGQFLHDLQLSSAGETIASTRSRIAKQSIPSLAVLPFVNQSRTEESEVFSDGLTEELINALTRVKGLRVTSRTSAFALKGKQTSAREVGNVLGVGLLLEGSVRTAGNRLRLTVQLIDIAKDTPIWSERYDRVMEDIFALQDEITQTIVKTLEITLQAEERAALVKRYTNNLDAYSLYLKGRHCWNAWNPESLQRGIQFFEQAIAMEPEMAPAFTGIADSYLILGTWASMRPLDALAKAKAAALRALELDDSLAEAHSALASIKAIKDFDWKGAEAGFQLAMELNPNYAVAPFWYAGTCLLAMARLREATKQFKRAQELDPLSLTITTSYAWSLYLSKRFDEAIIEAQKALDLDSTHLEAYWPLAASLREKGKFDEAGACLKKAMAIAPNDPMTMATVGHTLASAGKTNEARHILGQLDEAESRMYVSPIYRAWIFAGLGETDAAFRWLEKAYEERDFLLRYLNLSPALAPLRSDPRFFELLGKMGLLEEGSEPTRDIQVKQ